MNLDAEKIINENGENPVRQPYSKPVLEDLGDLRTLTLGGSPTAPGDLSGDFNTRPLP